MEASHWLVHDNTMIFAWHAFSGGVPLPAEMGIDGMAGVIMGWLAKAEYGCEPDIDGSVDRGWELKSHWEIMPDHPGRFYFMFTVAPYWMEYHK